MLSTQTYSVSDILKTLNIVLLLNVLNGKNKRLYEYCISMLADIMVFVEQLKDLLMDKKYFLPGSMVAIRLVFGVTLFPEYLICLINSIPLSSIKYSKFLTEMFPLLITKKGFSNGLL